MPTEIERLYREHRAGLVRLVERELHDHHEAEDVVQTAFLDAQRALESGTVPRNPRAWLAAIALNAGRRLRRRRLNAEPLEDFAVQEASRMPEIRGALAGLPGNQRAAVLYRDVLGLSYDETAEQMGTSVNAVTMLLYRGRQRLRETLGVTSGGAGWWRWLSEGGATPAAVAKGAAAVVVATGLATGGVVAAGRAAREAAPATAEAVAAAPKAAAGSGTFVAVARQTPRAPTHGSTRPRARAGDDAKPAAVAASTQSVGVTGAAATQGSVLTLTTAPSTSTARVTTNLLSTLPSATLPAVAATATVATPITTVTVATPTVTTATITTPVTTVTLPVP